MLFIPLLPAKVILQCYGEFLKEVPQCIYNLYDKIFSDPNGKGQVTALLEGTLHKDWSVRSNTLNPVEGTGPGTAVLKGIMSLFGAIAPDMKFKIQKMWIHEDKVIVMKKVLESLLEHHLELMKYLCGLVPIQRN